MLVFGRARNAQWVLAIVGFDADAVALHGLIELLRCDHNGALQATPVFHFLVPADVPRNRKRELDKKRHDSKAERQCKPRDQAIVSINRLPQIAVKNSVLIDEDWSTIKIKPSSFHGVGRQLQWQRFAYCLRRAAAFYVLICGQVKLLLPVGNVE